MRYPTPSRPEIISAETTQIQATPIPTDSPPKTPGRLPGSTTRNSTSQRLPPRVRTDSSHSVGKARTACRVLTMIGKYAARKVMKTIPASSLGNNRMATGTIAIAGMGRASSVNGPKMLANSGERPSQIPVMTPKTAARPKPVRIRMVDWPRSSQYCSVPMRLVSAATISVTVGRVSNLNPKRTLLAVRSCQSNTAAATDDARTPQAKYLEPVRRAVATSPVRSSTGVTATVRGRVSRMGRLLMTRPPMPVRSPAAWHPGVRRRTGPRPRRW
ncbi:Uncharacterised protein [Mycobacteroides abscessus subsp. abscessus]|nr:Uncharacterised protein [Mycobacteroides abscessus subsp. abscessus]